MEERKLAHVEKVIAIESIPNADTLEMVIVLGWKCVVKKGRIKVGDLVCYIEIDSIVPDIPYFDFMKERKFRVKTIKLRGQISQGLVIPLEDIGMIISEKELNTLDKPKEGSDLTKVLNITKWLSPSERESDYVGTSKKKHNWFIKFMTRFDWYRKITKTKSKSFPEWISKTDEERVQNMPWILKNKNPFIVTEKLDGQSATYWIKKKLFGFEYGICSRSIRKFEYDNSNWSKAFRQLNIKAILKKMYDTFGLEFAIQGELIGPNIQGNKYNVKDYSFYIFNIFIIKQKKYVSYSAFKHILTKIPELISVPVINEYYLLPDTIDELLEYTTGDSNIYNTLREGIVIRSFDRKISFKAVSPKFLLKHGE